MVTASDISMEHYERPEVREAILSICNYQGAHRALNGGDGWYAHKDGKLRLRGIADYDDTISKHRSLYMTADIFTNDVFGIWEDMVLVRGREALPQNSIGSRGDLVAYMLLADIDTIDDPDDKGDENGNKRSKIYHEGRIEALESAATFMVKYLKDNGIHKSVEVLFSGRGIYVWLHPELSDMYEVRLEPNFDKNQLDYHFHMWLIAFNDLLADISDAFFLEHPEHRGRVKFDKLNNQKRKIKCLLSIHKSLPFAVIPLDKNNIRINLDDARIPLKQKTLENVRRWLKSWSAGEGERSALVKLLKPYSDRAKEDLAVKRKLSGNVKKSNVMVPIDSWCPFYKAALQFPGGEGSNRVCGALATWLYQAGWPETEALEVWGQVADRCGVETRIFYTSYGVISSPSCETIKKRGAGYPVLRFGELGLCQPDESCESCRWPGDYQCDGIEEITEEELSGLDMATRPRLRNDLEPDHFISQFMEYGATTSDAYQEYYYSGALVLLSMATCRKLVIKIKQGKIYPNMWCFNLGPSTISRKTTAMAQMEDMLKAVCPGEAIPKSFSPEALIEYLSEYPVSYLVKDEVGHLLANMRKSYMEEVRDFFSEIYDCRDFRRKLRTGKRKDKTDFQITDPFVVQSYATTNTLFREYTTTLDLTSGWLMRFLYFAPNYRKPSMAFDVETGAEAELYGRSLGRFSALHRLFSKSWERPICIDRDAMEYFQKWQLSTEEALMIEGDEVALALFGRLQVYALKLAVLFTVGRNGYDVSDSVPIRYMREAVRQVSEYFLPVGRSVVREVGRDEQNNLQNKIIGTLERGGGKMSRRDLLRDLHVRLKDVAEALDALEESGEIEVRKEQRVGMPSTIWYILCHNCHISHNSHISLICHTDSNDITGYYDTNVSNVTNATFETAGPNYVKIDDELETAAAVAAEHAKKFKTPGRMG